MNPKPTHTPTPWYLPKDQGSMISICEESDGRFVAHTQTLANAAHIVKCVNLHDELVQTIHRLQEFVMINCADPKQAQGQKAIALVNESAGLLTRAKAAK